MIDEKKFAAELQQWKNRLGDSYDEELAAIILKAVIDKLNIQPKIDVPDKNVGDKTWIPVSEKMPEDDNYILVSFENFSIPDIARYESNENGGSFYPGDDKESYVSHRLFVNAWRPLPESYKGE